MNPSLKNQNSANMSAPDQFYKAAMGNSGVFMADSSNPFYTTQVNGLVIASIAFSAGVSTYTFSGTPDLSEVMVGNALEVYGCTDNRNNGKFTITAVNNGANTISVSNVIGVAQASAGGGADTIPFDGARIAQAMEDAEFTSFVEDSFGDDSYIEDNGLLASQGAVFGIITEVVVSSGVVRLYLI
jgi:hypothetical protein